MRQEKFAVLYARSGKIQESAIQAGYSPKTAAAQATELLKKPEIRARKDAELDFFRKEQLEILVRATSEAIGAFLDEIRHGKIGSMARVQAGDKLMHYAGMDPVQKSEVSGPDGQPLEIGVVAIPAKTASIEEWAKNREERKAIAGKAVIDADAK